MGQKTPLSDTRSETRPGVPTNNHAISNTASEWSCDLGQNRIQDQNPRIKVPERVVRTMQLAGRGESDLVFWGLAVDRTDDQYRHYPVLSNTKSVLEDSTGYKSLGHTSIGRENIVRICKRFFDDFDGHGFPVPSEARMQYGEQRTFITTSELVEDDERIVYLLTDADIAEKFSNHPIL